MQLQQAHRKEAKIKMALQGPSGSGKTMSALLLAIGITNDWNKVAVIDTEKSSAHLYSNLGNYKVITIQPPYSPESYIEAITICENAGMEVVIIDSISHCWEYLLDFHSNLAGNSFQNWAKVNPRLNAFIDKVLHTPCHIIATMRTKQAYVLNLKDGKYVPEKVALKSVFRDGIEYEFTIVFDINFKHNAIASKDRTQLFAGKSEFMITPSTGKDILGWCNTSLSVEDIRKQIYDTVTMDELIAVFKRYPTWFSELQQDFNERKAQLHITPAMQPNRIQLHNINSGGSSNVIQLANL